MNAWILILTLITPNGVSVTSVPGFTYEWACTTAGQKWANSQPGAGSSYMCVNSATQRGY